MTPPTMPEWLEKKRDEAIADADYLEDANDRMCWGAGFFECHALMSEQERHAVKSRFGK